MKKKDGHIVKWKSRLTGYEGQGTTKFPIEVAGRICRDADREIPELDHWIGGNFPEQ